MSPSQELERENAALRDRLTRLSEASRRINESLDLDTVLQGALDSARSLTGAGYGVITLLEDTGRIGNFLSSGMTPEEARRIWDTPDGMRIFEYLGGLSEPLRIPDLLGRLREMGLPEISPPAPVGSALSFLAAPVLHRGECAGHIFVAGKEDDGEFTAQDQETLVLFASQAALVIANARRYREEQRVRKDLETLIDTSPVGVVVFDAHSGVPLSFNREARRIVDGLRDPDQSPEQLLGVMTVRRADGREVSLDKLPLAQALGQAETVRAERIVMQVPDGRAVTALVNATPIQAGDGGVQSFVVTLQDLAPLEELESMRADFLETASHELRMPLSSIKGSADAALGRVGSMERAEIAQFLRIIELQADLMQDLIGDLLDLARIETGTLSLHPEPTELAALVEEAKDGFVSAGGRNGLEVELAPGLPWVMADRGRVAQVLGNLVSIAAKQSPDGLPVHLSAVLEGTHVAVSVSDRGRDVPAGLAPRPFRGFSRAGGGARGPGMADSSLGLAVCQGIVEALGGRLRSEGDGAGLGVRFTLTLPAADLAAAGGPVRAAAPSGLLGPESRERERVLAVDGDPQTRRYVHDALSRAGFSPTVTGDPEDVPRLMEEEEPHLVLLDMLLPGAGGIELMNTILAMADVPVIFLSAYGEDGAVARAFDMGAADYVVKPFSATELTARIRAALRRGTALGWSALPDPYHLGDLSIDYAERRVTVAGRTVQLARREYEVLYRLSTLAGRVVTHDQLLQWAWDRERRGEHALVRNVVKTLRGKIGDDAENPRYIFTEPRVGYRMVKGEETVAE